MEGRKLMNQDRDKWKKIQEKTFTNWFNDRLRGNLKVAKRQILSLETDLVNGLMLIELLEKLTAPKTLPRHNKNPRQKVQMIENLGTALQFIYAQNIKLVNIGPEDIQGGNLKLILGLIWTLIKAYQIRVTSKGISTKKALLAWINSIIPEYGVKNFTLDWNDGRALCGVVDYIRPGACPNHQALNPSSGLENCKLGVDLSESLFEIPKLIDPEDMNNPSLDELSMMTYISYFCSPTNAILLDWIRKKIPQNNIRNLSTDWNDGSNLGALGEACFEGLCPNWSTMEPSDAIENNKLLLRLMNERLGLVCPVSPAELADPKIDELIVATYLSQFRNAKIKASPEEFGLRLPSLPNGSALVKEPVIFEVELTEQTANLKDSIRVTAHGPSADVKVKLNPKGKYNMEAVFIPTEAGSYDIMAIYQDEHISGSPVALPVADPGKCAIFGDIPSDMQVGKEECFTVKAREAGIGSLTCTADDSIGAPSSTSGKSEPPLMTTEAKKQENDQFEVKLVPNKIGHASVHLKWANTDIPRTPFDVNICDASKAVISGNEDGGGGKVGDSIAFQVTADVDKCGSGTLKVMPRGPSANYTPDVRDKGNGCYDVAFVPWEVGPHKVDVEYGGGAVSNSPLTMNIAPAPNANTCSASGKGLKRAIAGEDTTFQIISPESGLLAKKDPSERLDVAIVSPESTATVDITDNDNGSYTVKYNAPLPGCYDIAVKFYDDPIPGSPFRLDVVPSADASKCKAYGPALHPNSLHIAGNPLDMLVDTTLAGTGDLRVIIIGPEEIKPKVFIANESGIYSIKWDVPVSGRYNAHIWWADQYIPDSPFKIKVSPAPNARMVKAYGPGLDPTFEIGTDSSVFTLETKDAGIGTLTVRVHGVKGAFKIKAEPINEKDPRNLHASYDPTEPGDYIIAIRWSGVHVPGSPFKINIKEPPKPKPDNELKERERKERREEKEQKEKEKKSGKEKREQEKERKEREKERKEREKREEKERKEREKEAREREKREEKERKEREKREKKEKMKPTPPKIYLSHVGDSSSNVKNPDPEADKAGIDDDDTPRPTPLSEVDKKKKLKWEGDTSQPESSTTTEVSSDEAIRQAQIALLRSRRPIPETGPGPKMQVVSHTRQVHTTTSERRISMERKISTGEMKETKEKKKRKKF